MEAKFVNARAALERNAKSGTSAHLQSEGPFTADAERELVGIKVIYTFDKGGHASQSSLYFFDMEGWIVKIRTTAETADKFTCDDLDGFVRAHHGAWVSTQVCTDRHQSFVHRERGSKMVATPVFRSIRICPHFCPAPRLEESCPCFKEVQGVLTVRGPAFLIYGEVAHEHPAVLALGCCSATCVYNRSVVRSADYRTVDLTHAYDSRTLYWPSRPPMSFELQKLAFGVTPGGWFYAANRLCTPEHGGTHLDAPIHFHERGQTTEQLPLEKLLAPGVRIDVTRQARADRNYRLSREDVLRFERRAGRIEPGTIVLLHTGWSRSGPTVKSISGMHRVKTPVVSNFRATAKMLLSCWSRSARWRCWAWIPRPLTTVARKTSSSIGSLPREMSGAWRI